MLELLRDPIWQFIGAVLAALGIGAAFLFSWLQRQIKELAFGIVSSRRAISVADEVSSRVTIHLDGKIVKNLHLLVFGLKNSGHRAITQSDFERPFNISFSDGQVVSAEVTSQVPANLGATLAIAESSIELQPLLLNAGDKMLLQVLLSAPSPSYSVDTRILDVSALAPINVQPRRPPFFQSALPIVIGFWILFAAGTYIFKTNSQDTQMSISLLGLALVATLYGLGMPLLERKGPSSRRYIGEE